PAHSRYFRATGAESRRSVANRTGAVAVPFAATNENVASPFAADRRDWDPRTGRNPIGGRSAPGTGSDRAARARIGRRAQGAQRPATRSQAPSMASGSGWWLHQRRKIHAVELDDRI